MAGVNIGWDNTSPTSVGLAGQGDDELRSFKSNVQGGLNAEHIWPSSGGASGAHRAGSARIFSGAESAVSSADTSGRLMVTSDTSRLFAVGSDVSAHLLGSQLAPEVRSPNTISPSQGWTVSALTLLVKNSPTAQNYYSIAEASTPMAWVTVDGKEDGSASSAFATIGLNLIGSGGVPVIYLWEPSGDTYSGDTLVCHLMVLSAENL